MMKRKARIGMKRKRKKKRNKNGRERLQCHIHKVTNRENMKDNPTRKRILPLRIIYFVFVAFLKKIILILSTTIVESRYEKQVWHTEVRYVT